MKEIVAGMNFSSDFDAQQQSGELEHLRERSVREGTSQVTVFAIEHANREVVNVNY